MKGWFYQHIDNLDAASVAAGQSNQNCNNDQNLEMIREVRSFF
jgi:hypothetical protein